MTALGLLLVMPVFSRVVLPGVVAAPTSGASMHGMAHEHASHEHADPLDVCGYCSLMVHSAILTGSVDHVAPASPAAWPLSFQPCLEVLTSVLKDCQPRGPPRI